VQIGKGEETTEVRNSDSQNIQSKEPKIETDVGQSKLAGLKQKTTKDTKTQIKWQ